MADKPDVKPKTGLPNNIKGEDYLYGILRGTHKFNRAQMEAAKALLPFEKPRLNAVDATVKSVDMTHEQWLQTLAEEDEENGD